MSVQERLLAVGVAIFVVGIALLAVFDTWWALAVQIVGGVVSMIGAWWS